MLPTFLKILREKLLWRDQECIGYGQQGLCKKGDGVDIEARNCKMDSRKTDGGSKILHPKRAQIQCGMGE